MLRLILCIKRVKLQTNLQRRFFTTFRQGPFMYGEAIQSLEGTQ